jgi:hypothetical protein
MKAPSYLVFAALGLALPACETARHVEKPLFTGSPTISAMRFDLGALDSLGTPPPAKFKTLHLSIRDGTKGVHLGDMNIALSASSDKLGETSLQMSRSAFGGKCTVMTDDHDVQLGGLLTFLRTSTTWSNDCNAWGASYGRRELVQVRDVQGQLFPLAVGARHR